MKWTEILVISFFLLISSDLCHKMTLELLTIPLICLSVSWLTDHVYMVNHRFAFIHFVHMQSCLFIITNLKWFFPQSAWLTWVAFQFTVHKVFACSFIKCQNFWSLSKIWKLLLCLLQPSNGYQKRVEFNVSSSFSYSFHWCSPSLFLGILFSLL